MSWPEAFATVGAVWGMMSLPLAIIWRNVVMAKAILAFKDKHPDIDVKWKVG